MAECLYIIPLSEWRNSETQGKEELVSPLPYKWTITEPSRV